MNKRELPQGQLVVLFPGEVGDFISENRKKLTDEMVVLLQHNLFKKLGTLVLYAGEDIIAVRVGRAYTPIGEYSLVPVSSATTQGDMPQLLSLGIPLVSTGNFIPVSPKYEKLVSINGTIGVMEWFPK